MRIRHILAVAYVALLVAIVALNTPARRAERSQARIQTGMTISQALDAASGYEWVAYSEACMVVPAQRRSRCAGQNQTFRNQRELIQWLEQRVTVPGQTWELRLMFRGPGENVDLLVALAENGTVASVFLVTERRTISL